MPTCLELLGSIFYLVPVANLLLLLGCQLPQILLREFLHAKEFGGKRLNTVTFTGNEALQGSSPLTPAQRQVAS